MPKFRSTGAKSAGAAVLAAVLLSTTMAYGQTVPDVPRNRTLISQGWDYYNAVPSTENFNPYAGVLLHQRNSLHYTVNEALFYTNRSEEHTSELQSLMRISYAVFCL